MGKGLAVAICYIRSSGNWGKLREIKKEFGWWVVPRQAA
jgi:hypothetical protein